MLSPTAEVFQQVEIYETGSHLLPCRGSLIVIRSGQGAPLNAWTRPAQFFDLPSYRQCRPGKEQQGKYDQFTNNETVVPG
jgi:hypothetical protein